MTFKLYQIIRVGYRRGICDWHYPSGYLYDWVRSIIDWHTEGVIEKE